MDYICSSGEKVRIDGRVMIKEYYRNHWMQLKTIVRRIHILGVLLLAILLPIVYLLVQPPLKPTHFLVGGFFLLFTSSLFMFFRWWNTPFQGIKRKPRILIEILLFLGLCNLYVEASHSSNPTVEVVAVALGGLIVALAIMFSRGIWKWFSTKEGKE